jgi:hypothetical protein
MVKLDVSVIASTIARHPDLRCQRRGRDGVNALQWPGIGASRADGPCRTMRPIGASDQF